MARGSTFASLGGSLGFGTDENFTKQGPSTGPCETDPPANPVAREILQRFNIPPGSVLGDPLIDYDIKTQDALTMLKLSLLAESLGSTGEGIFKEVYINRLGIAEAVIVGQTTGELSGGVCVLKTKIYEQEEDDNKVDHVILRGGDPLPIKKHSDTAVDIMDSPGVTVAFNFSCGLTEFIKNDAFQQEAWAMFNKSPQHPDIKKELREAVNRAEWEQALGYKHLLPPIPSTASIGQSQTTPQILNMNFAGIEAEYTLDLGSPEPGAGGVTDVSNVNAIAAQVLDIQTGAALQKQVEEYPAPEVPETIYGLTDNDIYVFLDNYCTIKGLSRGEHWFLLPGSINGAKIKVKRSDGSAISYKVFGGLSGETYNIHYFRRISSALSSMSDFVLSNVKGEIPPTAFEYDPDIPAWQTTDPRMMFDQTYGAEETGFPGPIRPGFGTHGMEIFSLYIAYTIQQPSIQVRTAYAGAPGVAASIANAGIFMTPVVVVDAPAPIGYKGLKGYEAPVEQPPPAEDENEEIQCPETIIDNLEGTIVDISAPFLGEEQVGPAAQRIYDYIQADDGKYYTLTYTNGGYNILPGMRFNQDGVDGVVHNIEFIYADKDSVATNITIGPAYFEGNSYSDSKYVKRSVSLTRTATVLEGSNRTGEFVVEVEGLGNFNAFNGLLESIYPGDRVEVKISNFVVEP